MRGRAPRSWILALCLLSAASLGAQIQQPAQPVQPSGPAAASPSAAGSGSVSSIFPTASAKPENPFRRFEIVSLGAFPIMLFYSDFFFDLDRYAANGFNYLYVPWPFKTQSSAPLTDSDRYARIGAALGACVVVGAVDAYLHAMKIKKAQRLREAQDSAEP